VNPPEQETPSPPARDDLLADLNEAQQEAVTHESGPLLVLAGAGSGKTRVITHRIAYLIVERGVPPSRIVAVTFTNKAAAEMRERVERLLGTSVYGAWISTFHSMCLRILRRDGSRVGVEPGFNIYDGDDQRALIKRILKSETGDEAAQPPRSFLSRISRAKNAMQSPDDLERRAFGPERKLLVRVYRQYQEILKNSNAVDFDDLLLRTIELFRGHPDVLEDYSDRCLHLLVDEYQDTNRPQYLLVRSLSSSHGNVTVVGDEDQCIYRFRGAELGNILGFEADHDGTRTIRLEQNYRSTGAILRAAGAVVANNVNRKGKTLWTQNPDGDKIELFRAPDDRTEAAWIARRIQALQSQWTPDQTAVLYRTNAQSRLFEEIFRQERIPFQIVGSVQFYARKEIKDVLAYLRVVLNPADDVSFRRVLNTPQRGIGATTLGLVERVAGTTGLSLMRAAAHALDENLLGKRPSKMLAGFLDLIAELRKHVEQSAVPEMLERVVQVTDYEAHLDKAYAGLGSERMENVRSLISAAVEYAEDSEDATLLGFLDRSALVADADDVGRTPGVTMMTVHCAKGLEFPVVFLTGLEENLFPHAMSLANDDDIEEERRLCYVAMTRARQRLLLSSAKFRRVQGVLMPNRASRFIEEIPREIVDDVSGTPGIAAAGESGLGWGGDDWGPAGSSAARAAARRRRERQPAPVPKSAALAGPHDDGFDIGAVVRHPRFGGGTILDREGSGKHLKLTIQFAEYGRKKILPAYTELHVGGR
jgi:DNA helicase-2/ATP-dependent DNA helicase PcrA